jgi:ATP-dependent DNA helicase RecQ
MSIEFVYKSLISNFYEKYIAHHKDAIIFFQGFPGVFYKVLNNLGYKHLIDYDLSNKYGYCNYHKIDNSRELRSLLSAKGHCWAFYEELIAIAEILNDLSIYSGDLIVVKNNLFSDFYPIEVLYNRVKAIKIFDGENNADDVIIKYYSDMKIYNHTPFFSYVNKHYPIDLNKEINKIDFFENKNPGYVMPEQCVMLNPNELEFIKYRLVNGELQNISYAIEALETQQLKIILPLLNTFGSSFNVTFKLNRRRTIDPLLENEHLDLFRKYWGESATFRYIPFYEDPAVSTSTVNISQGFLLAQIINQAKCALGSDIYSDLIITAPTGAGKSLFFQIPAIYLHVNYNAITLVITPLIALMNDQVLELNKRGVNFATYLNSEITYEERRDRLFGIHEGKYSIVYLSPELLLSNDIDYIIGERKIGLFVIDEAHLVTSWGRDFRVDYWFLGDYIERLRRGNRYNQYVNSMQFPILCLTATAVFGGRDDVVGDLQNSLNLACAADKIFIGYVRRDSIENPIHFKITTVGEKKSNTKKETKIDLTCQKIFELIESGKKSIVYFPYVSQIEDVYKKIITTKPEYIPFIERYSGSGMDKYEKNDSYLRFRDAKLSIMLATKAFGMGINIHDVEVVYHYAPTGTLADYVQEIGRAARKLPVGYAVTDYLKNDMTYAKILWGLSGLRHYQIKSIMKKLYDLYVNKKSRYLLISPEVFSFLFDAVNIDNKVKSGLMLLSSDLLEKYHFRVINVRAKSIFTINYICVPNVIKKSFLKIYGPYCKVMTDVRPRIQSGYGRKGDIITTNTGDIYEIDLSRVWEDKFDDMTFAKFKYHFFIGDLFEISETTISPRIKLVIHYNNDYEQSRNKLLVIVSALQKTFNQIKREYGGRIFTFDDFVKKFNHYYEQKIKREFLAILIDLFCYDGVYFEEIPSEQWKFIERRKESDSEGLYGNTYCFRTNKHSFIEMNVRRYLQDCSPNNESGTHFTTYLPVPKNGGKYSEYQLVASLLEMFGLATYELIGGKNPQIFVRINDPLKLRRIAELNKPYRNSLLTQIEERHKTAVKIVNGFMSHNLTDNQRWSVIEHYFLGHDEIVDKELGIYEI